MDQTALGLADELAIGRLMATYSQCVDDGRFPEAASLFTADGVFDYSGRRWVGQEAIRGFLEEFQTPERRGRHSCGTPLTAHAGEDGVRAVTDFVFFGRSDGAWFVKFVGRYHDRLRQEAGAWRIAARKVVLADAGG